MAEDTSLEYELPDVLTEWRRVLTLGGRLAVVAISKEGKQGVVMKAYEWTHKHFPNLMDCPSTKNSSRWRTSWPSEVLELGSEP